MTLALWTARRTNVNRGYPVKNQHEIIGVYKDTKSRKDLTRPGIERLLIDAKAKKFDLIVESVKKNKGQD